MTTPLTDCPGWPDVVAAQAAYNAEVAISNARSATVRPLAQAYVDAINTCQVEAEYLPAMRMNMAMLGF